MSFLENEKPYWINPENGLEWYIDKLTTRWCSRDFGSWKVLDATVFFVVKRKGESLNILSRVLIHNINNEVLADETSLEAIGSRIEILRMQLS